MTTNHTEAELEKFRQAWKEEVSAKTKKPRPSSSASASTTRPEQGGASSSSRPPQLPPVTRQLHNENDVNDEIAPQGYHDIDEVASGISLDGRIQGSSSSARQPETALEHYEKAVEKESQGSLGDSLSLYRKAFRMDAAVDKKYKNKHFPPSAFAVSRSTDPNSSNQSTSVQNTGQHSSDALASTATDLISQFSGLSIKGEPPPTELSPPPPCPIANMPNEILSQILLYVASTDIAIYSKLARVCKALAFLVVTEDTIWKQIVHGQEYGLSAMHYQYVCTVLGKPIETSTLDASPTTVPLSRTTLPLTSTYPTYRRMFRARPRIRFNGCYISTVNYTRPGMAAATSVTWNSPVLIVTYYRYLRFFRDGSLISLLTTSEPKDVVPYLYWEHVHRNHTGALPQSAMKDALKGRWRLSGDPWQITQVEEESQEAEGDVIIETESASPKYMNKMHLSLASAGKGTRNNKLAWRGYWSWNKLTDDWAEYGLKNDRAFYWSRVRSFGTGL